MTNQTFNISLSEYSGEVCLVLYHSPCHLNCNWCFNRNNLKNVLLDYDVAVKNITDNRDYITSVCLTGGEPLLSSDFYRICEYCHDDGLKVKVNTSGTITPNIDLLSADYVNVSFKGCFDDYVRYGYADCWEKLKDNLNIYSSHEFFGEVEWSVVYHKWLVDLNRVYGLMLMLDELPDYFTLSQLQVGECNDGFVNDFSPPDRNELARQISIFKNLPQKHLIIESKEYGREIIKT